MSDTHVLQMFSALLALAALAVMIVSIITGKWHLVPIQAAVIAVNAGLFVYQRDMR